MNGLRDRICEIEAAAPIVIRIPNRPGVLGYLAVQPCEAKSSLEALWDGDGEEEGGEGGE